MIRLDQMKWMTFCLRRIDAITSIKGGIKKKKKKKKIAVAITVLAKSAGLPEKTVIFSFCPAKTLSDKCPVNLSKENIILITNMPSVLQISVLQKNTVCLTAVLHQSRKDFADCNNVV